MEMSKKEFYKLLSEIHNEIAGQSCGCMGSGYTEESVELNDTHRQDYNNPRKVENGVRYPTYVKKDKPSDYVGDILRKYIDVK